MKRTCLLILIMIAFVSLPAQTSSDQPKRPKVGVVLGGGGAKGASHIGALKMRWRNSHLQLEIPFSHESLFDKDPNATFISQLPSAYVNNSSLINLFNDLCVGYQEDMDFNNLPIPFACVATNIVTGEEEWYQRQATEIII